MKVCFLSSMHPALDKRVFDKEALTLAQAGHEVVHVCPGQPGVTEEQGVRLVQYKAPKGIWGRLAQFPRLYKLARAENADVYHCNEVDSWIVGAFLCRRRRVCIFDVHEHYPSAFSEIRYPWFPGFLRPVVSGSIRLLYRVMAPWTDYFVLAKQTLAYDFRHAEEKIVIVRNFSRIPQDMDQRPSRKSDKHFNVVHLGAIGRARGWPQMLDALALVNDPDVRLRIIGSFNDGSEAAFWEHARTLGVDRQIEFREWIPFREAFQLLQSSDAGIIAFQPGIQNHTYASPHKFFDYMAAGLPVIAPDFAVEITGIMKDHDVGLLIDPSDPISIANAIRTVKNDPARARQWGSNGVEAVHRCFNWGKEAGRLTLLYGSMRHINFS